MTVHFICKGNVFRSRLAEAYLNSKQIPNLKVISSGIDAQLDDCGPITWYAQRIIQQNSLVPFEKSAWDQTTKDLFKKGDLTVFMDQSIYDFCVKNLNFNSKNFKIWRIGDMGPLFKSREEEIKKVKFTEKMYEEIKKKISDLVGELVSSKA